MVVYQMNNFVEMSMYIKDKERIKNCHNGCGTTFSEMKTNWD